VLLIMSTREHHKQHPNFQATIKKLGNSFLHSSLWYNMLPFHHHTQTLGAFILLEY